MHVPDGFLDVPTSVATATVAAGAVSLAVRRAPRELAEPTAPLAGLVAAFVFAVQMLNFPVGVGTSGHLMGGALAAVLVGPWTGVLCLTVVLMVQALLFADGGLTALGTNITLMGVVTVVVGYAVTKTVLAVLPRRPASVVPAAAVGAFLSVPVAALVFVGLFEVGGAVELPLGTLTTTMVGWHLLIGVGEAVITALTVSAVVATRPDLVHAARGLLPELVVVAPDGTRTTVRPDAVPAGHAPRPGRRVLLAGTGVAVLLAGVVSVWASSNPDGLNYVAQRLGFLDSETSHAAGSGPFAGYGFAPLGDNPLGTSIAGVVGVLVVLGLGVLLARLVRRGRTARPLDLPADDDAHAVADSERV